MAMRRIEEGEPGRSLAWARAASGLALTLALAIAVNDAAAAQPLLGDGASHLEVSFGRQRVQVDAHASRQVLDELAIRVDGYPLTVPRAAFAGVTAPSSFEVTRREDGVMVLRIVGRGDTGMAYAVEVVFDRLSVRERRVVDPVSGVVRESLGFGVAEVLD